MDKVTEGIVIPESIIAKSERLQADYTAVYGRSFAHFYCPALFRDEETELCKAHIINEAFPDSSRAWTVQRKDIDNFYGWAFESDFVDLHKFTDISPAQILTDKRYSKKFNATVLKNNEPVDHLFAPQGVPQQFTEVQLENIETSTPFGLKIHPNEFMSVKDQHWEIEIYRDIRLAMIVSAIKAAHLTLFEMLGYRYVKRGAAYFIGRQILGEFYLQNVNKSKADVLKAAHTYFLPYVHMVRPLISGTDSKGTISDNNLYICMGSSGLPWAMIVFIKTSSLVHSVMIPIFDDPEQVVTFMDFLKNDHSNVQVASCHFERNQWELSKDTKPLIWPKEGVLYPPYPSE